MPARPCPCAERRSPRGRWPSRLTATPRPPWPRLYPPCPCEWLPWAATSRFICEHFHVQARMHCFLYAATVCFIAVCYYVSFISGITFFGCLQPSVLLQCKPFLYPTMSISLWIYSTGQSNLPFQTASLDLSASHLSHFLLLLCSCIFGIPPTPRFTRC